MNRCVVCGNIVPEGRLVCAICEHTSCGGNEKRKDTEKKEREDGEE
jgi:hypothetical protein